MRDLFRPGSHRALPLGSVIWSNPGSATVTSIVPAVPSASGVADVFAFQADGTVQAITSEGTTAWTANVSDGTNVVPDFAGGLVALEWNNGKGSVTKLDGKTGQRNPVYVPGGSWSLDPWDLAVHTDGTIFALQTNWDDWTVVGIDPTTGGQKFGVPVPIPAQAGGLCWGGVIVAGDGYAYVPFGWIADFAPDYMTNHLRVLRISSSGASDTIPISDWSSTFSELCAMHIGVITNADTGIALTWQSDPSMNVGPRMAITTGTSVSVMNGPVVPGQRSPVAPVLQAQDGSFVGSVWTTDGSQNMVAFDATGSVRWSVPNDQPLAALADGGVLGQSGITYDQSGGASGRIPGPPTFSWFGYAYLEGSLDQVSPPAMYFAADWWPFGHGSQSPNDAAKLGQWFPPLPSCTDKGGNCQAALGPRDMLWNAKNDLASQLVKGSACYNAAQQYVFNSNNLPRGDINGKAMTSDNFVAYIQSHITFYNGATSQADMAWVKCPEGNKRGVFCPGGVGTVRDHVSDTGTPTAARATT